MTTLQELLAQKEALEQKIAELKKSERDDALRSARSLIEQGKRPIQQVVKLADDPAVRHRIVFLPNYDIAMASSLYPGSATCG